MARCGKQAYGKTKTDSTQTSVLTHTHTHTHTHMHQHQHTNTHAHILMQAQMHTCPPTHMFRHTRNSHRSHPTFHPKICPPARLQETLVSGPGVFALAAGLGVTTTSFGKLRNLLLNYTKAIHLRRLCLDLRSEKMKIFEVDLQLLKPGAHQEFLVSSC